MRLGSVPAVVKASLVTPLTEELVLRGTRGTIVLPTPHYASEARAYDTEGKQIAGFTDTETKNGFVYELLEAMTCIRQGRLESPVVPHRDTIDCARIFDLIRQE